MDTFEPPTKRMKSDTEHYISEIVSKIKENKENLQPIISEEYYKTIKLTKVIVGEIKNIKDISKTILTLNQNVPLKELQHLKRVSKKEIILCHADSIKTTVQDFIKEKAEKLTDIFESFREAEVPMIAPKVKKQFTEANKVWPCNFHPNRYNERLVSGCFFSEQELKLHKTYMEMVFNVLKYYLQNTSSVEDLQSINASVVVDPSTQSVVAVAFDNRKKHPTQHTAMVAIDNVAKSQNGGAWIIDYQKHISIDPTHRGIDEKLLTFLKLNHPDVYFGAKKFVSKKDVSMEVKKEDIGPYLCTGYSVYMMREPCVMCAMALVHARARRVFFCLQNEELGALKTRTKLQTVSSLNHHFEVFTGFV